MSSPNLIFLHGWGTDAGVWEKQASSLRAPTARQSRSRRGEAISKKRDCFVAPKFTLSEANVGLLAMTLTEPSVLIGWSYGGMLAMEYAVKNPEKVKALVLVGCSAKFTDGMPPAVIRNIKRNLSKDFKTAMENCYVTFFSENEEAAMRKFIENQGLPDKKDTIGILDQLLVLDQRHVLKDIKVPTLIIHGDKDGVCPIAGGEFLNNGIAGSRIAVIKGAGHMPFYTRPDEFNKILEGFLDALD